MCDPCLAWLGLSGYQQQTFLHSTGVSEELHSISFCLGKRNVYVSFSDTLMARRTRLGGRGGGVGWGSHKNVCVKKAKGNVAMIIIVNIK